MFCTSCGAANNDCSKYCFSCGNALGSGLADIAASETKSASAPSADSVVNAGSPCETVPSAEPVSIPSSDSNASKKKFRVQLIVLVLLVGVFIVGKVMSPDGSESSKEQPQKNKVDESNPTKVAWASLRQEYEKADPWLNRELAHFDATVARLDSAKHGRELAKDRAESLELYSSAHEHFQSELSKGNDLSAARKYEQLEEMGVVRLETLSYAIDDAVKGDNWLGPKGLSEWLIAIPANFVKIRGLLDSYASDQSAIAKFGEDPTKMRALQSNAQQWFSQGRQLSKSDQLLAYIYLMRAQNANEVLSRKLTAYAEEHHRIDELVL